MKRTITLILVSLPLLCVSLSATSIDSIFANLHIRELSLLTKTNRLDLLDYSNCGQFAQVENVYFGKTALTKKTDTYLHIEMTSVSSVDLLLLPRLMGDSIVGVISTVTEPIIESQLNFYTLNGAPIHIDFKYPSITDFAPSLQGDECIYTYFPMNITYIPEDEVMVCSLSPSLHPVEKWKSHHSKFGKIYYKWSGESFQVSELEY